MCGSLKVERAYIMTIEDYLLNHLPPAQTWDDTEHTVTTSTMLIEISKALGEAVDWKELMNLLKKNNYIKEVQAGETYWLVAKS